MKAQKKRKRKTVYAHSRKKNLAIIDPSKKRRQEKILETLDWILPHALIELIFDYDFHHWNLDALLGDELPPRVVAPWNRLVLCKECGDFVQTGTRLMHSACGKYRNWCNHCHVYYAKSQVHCWCWDWIPKK